MAFCTLAVKVTLLPTVAVSGPLTVTEVGSACTVTLICAAEKVPLISMPALMVYSPALEPVKVKVPPFVAGKLIAQARAFSREQILSYVEFCVESEEAVKTGRLSDRLAVELLIARKYR